MFTTADIQLKKLEELKLQNELAELERQRKAMLSSLTVPPFPEEERTPQAKFKRVKQSVGDFWYFDTVYFPPGIYPDYSPPGKFHRELVQLSELRDKKAHVIHGPRDFAKTATLKKKALYDFLFGKRRYILVGSETLTPAVNTVRDIRDFLQHNERILFDYTITWLEESEEQLYAKSDLNPSGTYMGALSEERSARGTQRSFFLRPDYIYLTDFENLTSSLTKEAVEKRIERLNEMRGSLAEDGTLIWEGNNFDPDCAMNQLFTEEERGILAENIVMHRFAAWDKSRPKKYWSLWPERYPAATEEELRAKCQPKDNYDWSGNFQGDPKKKSGDIFPDTFYAEWDELPNDVRAVIYTDQNCSLKAKGDTTAMPCFGFSVKTQKYYLTTARCKSYSDPNDLLTDLLAMRKNEMSRGVRIIALGFDGNVAQESTWHNHVLNFSRVKGIPVPPIIFKKYHVDDLTKNLQVAYQAGTVLFPPGFRKTQEGRQFTDQFFAFRSKKAKRKDDAPDALICAMEMLHEEGIVSLIGDKPTFISVSKRSITQRF